MLMGQMTWGDKSIKLKIEFSVKEYPYGLNES